MKLNININQGCTYKITNLSTNKIYIGSTKTSIEQRFQEHLTAKDTSSLHRDIQELGSENFNIELVEKVEKVWWRNIINRGNTYIMAYNSIANGYNTKHSISLENLY